MRLTVELEGRPTVVDVADDLSSVEVGGRRCSVRVVDRGPDRVELEIGGETVVLRGWPEGQAAPLGPVDLNGERRTAQLRLESPGIRPSGVAVGGTPSPGGVASTVTPVPAGAAVVVPPMPGRIVEVRVTEGATVAAGAVLLVVEAMKMRNEIAAPIGGTVRDLRAREGASVRAREPLLTIVPT